MENSDYEKQDINIYDRQMISQIPYQSIEPSSGFGVFGLLVVAVIAFILFIVLIIIPTLSSSDNADYSGLGINSMFQKHDGWVYYADYAAGGLWRVRENGEDRVLICDDERIFFEIYEDRIFFITGNEGILCSMRTDGSERKVILDSEDNEISVFKFEVEDGWLYALTHYYKLLKIKTDGSELIELDHIADWSMDFCIDGDWIYYCAHPETEHIAITRLYRMQKDGSERQRLMKAISNTIDYADNQIYYIDIEDSNIYAVHFYGAKERKIAECDGGYFLKVIGEWVYFEDRGDKPGIYKVRRDGRQRSLITKNIDAFSYDVWDNWLLCYGLESVCAIKVSETEDTDELIKEIISDWPNVEIYE